MPAATRASRCRCGCCTPCPCSHSALLTLGATVWLLLAVFAMVFVAYVLLRIAYLKRQGRDLMAELKAPYAPFEEREAECAAMDAGK